MRYGMLSEILQMSFDSIRSHKTPVVLEVGLYLESTLMNQRVMLRAQQHQIIQ